VVQIAAVVADHERDDRQALGVPVAEDLDVRVGAPRGDGTPDERLLPFPDHLGADGFFEGEHETCPDRPDDVRGSALFAMLRVVQIAVLCGVDVGDRAAARHRRDPVGEQLAAGHQHTRGARASDHLVR
jgi:hypothetical protein